MSEFHAYTKGKVIKKPTKETTTLQRVLADVYVSDVCYKCYNIILDILKKRGLK